VCRNYLARATGARLEYGIVCSAGNRSRPRAAHRGSATSRRRTTETIDQVQHRRCLGTALDELQQIPGEMTGALANSATHEAGDVNSRQQIGRVVLGGVSRRVGSWAVTCLPLKNGAQIGDRGSMRWQEFQVPGGIESAPRNPRLTVNNEAGLP
jgi:hypothetical protein